MSTDRWMEKDVLHIYNRIFLSHIKEQNNSIYRNTYGPRSCHTEWRKSEKDQYHMIWLIYQYISTRPSRTNTKKRHPFHHRWLECKSRESRDTGVTGKFGLAVQNEAGQRLIEFCQKNALVIANTLFQQNKRWFYMWTSSESQYWNPIDYILWSLRWRSSVAQIMNS